MPRAILFGLYDTLVGGGSEDDRGAVGRAMGGDLGIDPDNFAAAYTRTRAMRFVGGLGDLEATVRAIAVQLGGSPAPSAVRLAATRRLNLTRRLLWPSAATLSALDDLRHHGWRLGLVGNCSAETPELWKRTPLGSRFDAVGFSCELGVAKPDPAIYLAVCSFLSAAATDCVYVGDGASGELAAAAGLGMAVVRTEEFTAADSAWPRERVSSLVELVQLVGVTGPPVRSPRSAATG